MHYLLVNRGRYLCFMHGGFCDSSDNYSAKCPLCDGVGSESIKTPNFVDRALQILKNTQSRSARSAATVTALFGILSGVSLLSERGLIVAFRLDSPTFYIPALLALCLLLAAIAAFMASMRHMPVTKEHCGKFGSKTPEEWERDVAGFIRKCESLHFLGNFFVILALSSLAFGVLHTAICGA
ncbi:hypothetical protein ACFQXB_01985 [Plastorhodobacter daqingensis]|uniref:Uncharacterized protein n=1 Tax=Plastorhodobacter daqingensis TaxID=1387281 RepID=A0ABW2UG48_9RHOB